MSSSGKITAISCQIDLGAIEPISNSLDFQTIVPHGCTFYAAQRFNQFNFGHHNDVDKSFTAHFMYVITKEEEKTSQSLNTDNSVWKWSLASKRVSLHNLNIRALLTFKFHRKDIHDIFIIHAKFYRIWGWLQKGHSIFKGALLIRGRAI